MRAYEVCLQRQILKDFSTTLSDCLQSFLVSSLCTFYFIPEFSFKIYIVRFPVIFGVISYCILYEQEKIKSTKSYARKS